MKKSTFITSYIILVFVLSTLFYTPLHELIWSTIVKIFPWHELSNSMMVMPLDGAFRLTISTIVFMFFMLMAPVAAVLRVQDKSNNKKLFVHFTLLNFYTVAVAFIEVVAYYFYFIHIIVPTHDAALTLLQFPLKEIGIFAFMIVISSSYVFYKKMIPLTTSGQSNEITNDKEYQRGDV